MLGFAYGETTVTSAPRCEFGCVYTIQSETRYELLTIHLPVFSSPWRLVLLEGGNGSFVPGLQASLGEGPHSPTASEYSGTHCDLQALHRNKMALIATCRHCNCVCEASGN